MVDIETLGVDPGAVICSLGAVRFDLTGPQEEFYREISLESCQDAGLEIEAGTLAWWLDQDADVRAVLIGGRPLVDVLREFSEWLPEDVEIWANSPSFDCEHLKAAYDAVGLTHPWEYYEERCVRTVRSLPGAVELEQRGDEHHALEDARHQAREVSQTLARLEHREDGDFS